MWSLIDTCSNDSTILGRLGIFVGFSAFFIMEKSLRVLGGDEGTEGHAHSHSHVDTPVNVVASGVSITPSADGLRPRGGEKGSASSQSEQVDLPQPSTRTGPSKLSAYLNLFGDFVHNMYARFLPAVLVCLLIPFRRTDGLA